LYPALCEITAIVLTLFSYESLTFTNDFGIPKMIQNVLNKSVGNGVAYS